MISNKSYQNNINYCNLHLIVKSKSHCIPIRMNIFSQILSLQHAYYRINRLKTRTDFVYLVPQSLFTFFLVLFVIIVNGYNASSQNTIFNHDHNVHFCADHKIKSSSIGIYDQDDRVHAYDVSFYGIETEVHPGSTYITGTTTIQGRVITPTVDSLVFELTNDLVVDYCILGEDTLGIRHENENLVIGLKNQLTQGDRFSIEIEYEGTPESGSFFVGIANANNEYGEPVVYTLSEPHNARKWFPVKQVLEDKADSAHIFVTAPQGFMAASNGLLHAVEEVELNKVQYQWKTFYPIAYYLISIAVANYQEYNFWSPTSDQPDADSIFVQNFIYNYPETLQEEKENIDRTNDFMILFSEIWGEYPFKSEKYGHAQAPMGGGMEHQTISTMGHFGFDITAHELAHHWYGNKVTCATWSDIWINEGFASYGEYLAREFVLSREMADQWMQYCHSLIKSQPDGSVYIPEIELNSIWRIFDGRLSYKKGAAILHLLRFEINNDPLYFHIMREFLVAYAHDVATGDDFKNMVEYITGEDWDWFFDIWYYGHGFPTYQLQWTQRNDSLFITSYQLTSSEYTDFFQGSIEFEITHENGTGRKRFFQTESNQTFMVPMSSKVENIEFDPDKYMLKNHTIFDSAYIQDFLLNRIRTYPNPFENNIYVEFSPGWMEGRFEIYDLRGKKIMEGILTHQKQKITLDNGAPGIYFMHIYAGNDAAKTIKMIRNR